MAKMIQLRKVPDALYRRLKAQAAMAGMSLSKYLLTKIRELAERPTLSELRERVERREPVSLPVSAAEILRAERRFDGRVRRTRRR